jgi:glutamate N-acetyltransferase/amino-acid N-acetyltransferase
VVIGENERRQFADALSAVCIKLAKDIVRDGEGATKFIEILVVGAPDNAAARQIAMTIATSPLVKTAFYGEDPNWGRIIAAAGRSGVTIDPAKMALHIYSPTVNLHFPVTLFANGMPTNYKEEDAKLVMHESEIEVTLECEMGEGVAHIWTCDLSHDYVSINGHYRT